MKKRKRKTKDAVKELVRQNNERKIEIVIEIFEENNYRALSTIHRHTHLQEIAIDVDHDFDDNLADVVLHGCTMQKNQNTAGMPIRSTKTSKC